MRIRLYRKQAAEFQWLADNASIASVQRRYRAIARHYSELADREERADKTRMAERLRQLRLKREEVAVQVRQSGEANDNLAIGLLRLMQIRARRRRPLAEEMVLLAEPSVTFALIQMSGPNLLRLALHRWRIRIFNFDPMRRTPRAIGRRCPRNQVDRLRGRQSRRARQNTR